MTNVYHLDDYRAPQAEQATATAAPVWKTATLAEVVAMRPEDRAAYFETRRQARERMAEIIHSRMPPSPATNPLNAATPILIHSVSWGRNAWHSTWIQRYRTGTLCESRAAAKRFIDKNRTQGSTYYATVMPGWHLQFDRRAYIVCEINTRRPFERLLSSDFLVPNVTEEEALELLEPGSPVWRGHRPNRDSIIVQQTKLPSTAFTSWADRTSFPGQMSTPGRYVRTIVGKDWFFSPATTEKGFEYDVSFFERMRLAVPT